MNMGRIDEAIEFAAFAHRSQTRKGTDTPYISHPFGVAMLLQQAGCKEDIIIAGVLHDTLEDTDTTPEDIQNRFGENVLKLVTGASEPDKADSWEERKQHTLDFLKTASLDVRQVACADKLHNLRSIRREMEVIGNAIWDKFNRGFEEQRWYYMNLVESLGYASSFPMLSVFRSEVEAIFITEALPDKQMDRVSDKFMDTIFKYVYCIPIMPKEFDEELSTSNEVTVAKQLVELTEAYRIPDYEKGQRKQKMFYFLTSKGIEFEINSEGTDIIISTCTAMKDFLQLSDDEVYRHIARSLERGGL